MTILVITPSYLPDLRAGGSVNGCHEFVKTVSKNFAVDVLTFNTLDDKITQRVIDKIKIKYLKRSKFFDVFSSHGWHFSISYIFYLIGNLRRYDVIYFRAVWNFPSLIGFIICSLANKPFIICSSGKFTEYALNSSRLKKKVVLYLFSYFIFKARAIHYASIDEYQQVALKKLRVLNKIILPNAVTSIDLHISDVPINRIKSSSLKFYTVSRLNPIKNIEYIIAVLARQPYQCELNIVGDGNENYVAHLKKYAFERMAVAKNFTVIFHGFKSRSWVDERFGKYIYLHASFSEGFSNSVLESIARGSITCVSEQSNMKSLAELGFLCEFDIKTNEMESLIIDIREHYLNYIQNSRAASKELCKLYSSENLASSFHNQLRGLL
jgi:glycosyltransferase involved in cell wall biosynthesis